MSGSSNNGTATSKPASSAAVGQSVPQQSFTSFVSFDGNSSSDASRKAVRKQAALVSAAARKATIAKKIAKQKDEEEQKKQSGGAVDERREGIKRKRSQEQFGMIGPWQAGISIIDSSPLPKASFVDRRPEITTQTVDLNDGVLSKSKPIVPGIPDKNRNKIGRYTYVRPPSTPSEEIPVEVLNRLTDTQNDAVALLSRSIDIPDACSQCHQLGEISSNWPVMSYDYSETVILEEPLPMTPKSLASSPAYSAGMMDPFNQYPVPYHPIYDRLLHYMLTIFAPRGWSSLSITHNEGLAYEQFMTQHALAEPALFLVRLLFASGDLIRLGVLDRRVAIALRTMAIQAINDALNDPERSVSDGLILAVGRIALTEALYGDKSAANTHRPAQRRMITLRGGMGALNFPPLIKRLMRWSDRVMSIQTNTPRLLLDDEDRGNTTLTINESLNLIEDWAPAEGKAMRKKIAISDLIT